MVLASCRKLFASLYGVVPDHSDPLHTSQLSHEHISWFHFSWRFVCQSFGFLSQTMSELEKRWTGYLASLSPEALEVIVYRMSPRFGRLAIRRSDALLHVCTHAHYTAAQVVNMLRHVGMEKLPDTMLIALAMHEAK